MRPGSICSLQNSRCHLSIQKEPSAAHEVRARHGDSSARATNTARPAVVRSRDFSQLFSGRQPPIRPLHFYHDELRNLHSPADAHREDRGIYRHETDPFRIFYLMLVPFVEFNGLEFNLLRTRTLVFDVHRPNPFRTVPKDGLAGEETVDEAQRDELPSERPQPNGFGRPHVNACVASIAGHQIREVRPELGFNVDYRHPNSPHCQKRLDTTSKHLTWTP